MAEFNKFTCKCGWTGVASRSYRYVTFTGSYRQYLCPDCHQIFEESVTIRVKECPNCGAQHKKFKAYMPMKDGCPKCGQPLTIDDERILVD